MVQVTEEMAKLANTFFYGTGQGRNACGLQSFLSPIVPMSVEYTSDDEQLRSRKKFNLQEKAWSIWFRPSLFLPHNDR